MTTTAKKTVICAGCLREIAATSRGLPVRHGWATNATMTQHSKCVGSAFAPITESVDGLREAVLWAERFLATPEAFGEGRARREARTFVASAPAAAAKYGHTL